MQNLVSPAEAVKVIESGDRVFIHSACAAPKLLIQAMTNRAAELKNVEIVQLHTEGPAPYTDEKVKDSFRVNALFIGGNVRRAVWEGRADYIPIFLSEVPILFRSRRLPLNVAMVQVSPPDRHGFCSLGISVDATRAAVEVADHVIAQINPQMPRTHGDGLVHISKFDSMVESNEAIPEIFPAEQTAIEIAIAKLISQNLVEDRATLQMGIGAIPDAVLAQLGGHKDLGIHTEMFAEGVIDLVEKGVITGKYKKVHPGIIVTGFLMGTRRLYDFVDDNPLVRALDIEYVNDVHIIRRNPRVTAINSAIEVDLTGQVSSDSIGTKFYSGVGGQMDFIRGASLSQGGKPIIALPSVTSKGVSRISKFLNQGAGVVTTRAHVHYVVTEYGIAELYGKNIRQRAKNLIEIAHPDHREELDKYAFEVLKVH
ncbi:MAG: acetyl-CoA hydrolase/transferase C-terminal domain-containing protein [Cytophagales bacterium]